MTVMSSSVKEAAPATEHHRADRPATDIFPKRELCQSSPGRQLWNEGIEASEDHRQSLSYTATEIPVGKPQVEFFERGNQGTPRGHVVRCQILSDAAIPPDVDEPFVSIDGRDFTLGEFMTMVCTFGGWGMSVEFVPNDELHQWPNVKIREPDAKLGRRSFSRRSSRS